MVRGVSGRLVLLPAEGPVRWGLGVGRLGEGLSLRLWAI